MNVVYIHAERPGSASFELFEPEECHGLHKIIWSAGCGLQASLEIPDIDEQNNDILKKSREMLNIFSKFFESASSLVIRSNTDDIAYLKF